MLTGADTVVPVTDLTVRHRRLAVLGAACALAIAACGGGSDDAAPAAAPAEPEVTAAPEVAAPGTEPAATDDGPTAAPVDAPPILQFTAPLVGGGEIDAAATAGSPTVFWFWAPT